MPVNMNSGVTRESLVLRLSVLHIFCIRRVLCAHLASKASTPIITRNVKGSSPYRRGYDVFDVKQWIKKGGREYILNGIGEIRFTHARGQLVGIIGTVRTSPDAVTWSRGRGQPGSLHRTSRRRHDFILLLNTHRRFYEVFDGFLVTVGLYIAEGIVVLIIG